MRIVRIRRSSIAPPLPVATATMKKKHNTSESFAKRAYKNHWDSPREGYTSLWVNKTVGADHPLVNKAAK